MLLDLLSPAEAAALGVADAYDRRHRQKAFFRMLRRSSGSPVSNSAVLAGLAAVLGGSGALDVGTLNRAAETLFAANEQLKEAFLALVPKS